MEPFRVEVEEEEEVEDKEDSLCETTLWVWKSSQSRGILEFLKKGHYVGAMRAISALPFTAALAVETGQTHQGDRKEQGENRWKGGTSRYQRYFKASSPMVIGVDSREKSTTRIWSRSSSSSCSSFLGITVTASSISSSVASFSSTCCRGEG